MGGPFDLRSPGPDPPWDLHAVIEIAAGGPPVKYEADPETGALRVDRFLHPSMSYPVNYGYVPGTRAGDGDAVDVLVATAVPVVPGAVVRVRPIGLLDMADEAGPDAKVLAVPVDALNPFYGYARSWRDLPPMLVEQVEHFFRHYKDLDAGRWAEVRSWSGPDEAAAFVAGALQNRRVG